MLLRYNLPRSAANCPIHHRQAPPPLAGCQLPPPATNHQPNPLNFHLPAGNWVLKRPPIGPRAHHSACAMQGPSDPWK